MSIKFEKTKKYPLGRYTIMLSCWGGGYRKRFVPVTETGKRDAKEKADDIESSLKKELKNEREEKRTGIHVQEIVNLEDLITLRIENEGDSSCGGYFNQIKKRIGCLKIENLRSGCKNFIKEISKEITNRGKVRSVNTINLFKKCLRILFRFAKEEKIIKEIPIKFKIEKAKRRDRIWLPEEKRFIYKALEDLNSWLFWPVYFAERNPIREKDLFSLQKENYIQKKNWIQFYAGKTEDNQPRMTYLKQIDSNLRNYFLSLPPDCPWLFPKIKNGIYCQAYENYNDYNPEWWNVLRLAYKYLNNKDKITKEKIDFHFHDLRHVAITYLVDLGYTILNFQNCGIHFTKAMIDLYYHCDAEKAPVLPGYEIPTENLQLLEGTNG